MRGEMVTNEQFIGRFNTFMSVAKAERDKEQDALGIDFQIDKAGKRRREVQRNSALIALKGKLESHTFKPVPNVPLGKRATQFLVQGPPFGILCLICDLIGDYVDNNVALSKHTWKLTFTGKAMETKYPAETEEKSSEAEPEGVVREEVKQKPVDPETLLQHTALMKVELHEIEKDARYMVSATRLDGSAFAFYETWDLLHGKFNEVMKHEPEIEITKNQ